MLISSFSKLIFCLYEGAVLELKPEALQEALNISVVSALVASQEVSINRKQLIFH